MKIEKTISILSFLVALFTILWLVTLVLTMQEKGSFISTFDEALIFVNKPSLLFYILYSNVVILTILNSILFALIYQFIKQRHAQLAITGIIFIPVYACYNLFVYCSQISIVQQIQQLYLTTEYEQILPVFLGQLIQIWDKSAMAFINNFAYAILGIPSILFGIAFYKSSKIGKLTGILLISNAIACIIGIIGIISGNILLSNGSIIGGVLFLFALFPMGIMFWKLHKSNQQLTI